MRFLIVDDHKNTRDAIAIGLAACGLQAATAKDADEALVRLETESFDWLVCDVWMPGRSGIELAARVRALDPSIGIVVMSAWVLSPSDQRTVSQLGGTYLTKPVVAGSLAHHCGATAARSDRRR